MTERAKKAQEKLREDRKAKLSYAYTNDQRDAVRNETIPNPVEWGKLWK